MAAVVAGPVDGAETERAGDQWLRVRQLRPALRSHVEIHRHVYRGRTWYVVQDRVSGRHFRFNESAYRYIARFDGSRTLAAIRRAVQSQYGDTGLDPAQLVRLLSQLHRADLILGDRLADTDELRRRSGVIQRRLRAQRWRSPLAVRVPLVDPERFLEATWPLARHLFSGLGMAAWLLTMTIGAALATMHWPQLIDDVMGRLLSLDNTLLLLAVFPVVKAMHELGHAYAIRSLGGEVHEMGILFLVFMPIPYIDASSSLAEPDKYRRALVGAAGMLVELSLAVAALLVWIEAEPGLVRAIAWNVMLIAGVSTVFFNANPLVRFDGYYILADLIEIPNLGTRAYAYLGWLFQTRLAGVPGLEPPTRQASEAAWLVGYALASFAYRLFIIGVIVWYLVNNYFFFGVAVAAWAVLTMVLMPVARAARLLFRGRSLQGHRVRALAAALGLLGGIGALFAIPIPHSFLAEGVVWIDRQHWVRSETDGFVTRIIDSGDTPMAVGDEIAVLDNVEHRRHLARLESLQEELRARYDAARRADLVRAAQIRQQLATVTSQQRSALERVASLTVDAHVAGRFVRIADRDIEGRYVQRGTPLGFIAGDDEIIVRVVVPQQVIDLVRRRLRAVEVRFASRLDRVYAARIVREIPTASAALPSLALASSGGGQQFLDPESTDPAQPRALDALFQLDLAVPAMPGPDTFGGRVHVRFSFPHATLAMQLLRSLRQLFLSRVDP